MKLKRGWTRYTQYGSRVQRSHFLEIWTQPYHYWLVARIYTWYDKLWWTNPVGKWISRQVDRLRGGSLLYESNWKKQPWSVKRDLRQFALAHKGRTKILDVPVDDEQYNLLRGHDE